MNYRHLYHAGNFADVFKHCVLLQLLQALQRKPKPLCYIDTHAGAGRYDFNKIEAKKTAEHQNGISKLWELSMVPPAIANYVQMVQRFNRGTKLRFYPGSPCIARQCLRAGDRMILSELQLQEYEALKASFPQDKQVKIVQFDGYRGLKSYLPPIERRGLVLIDPPFERANEFDELLKNFVTAYRRWDTGVYALWYPIKLRNTIDRFHQRLLQSGIKKLLVAELCIYPDDVALRLNGAGLIIANPPWQLDVELQHCLPWLWQQLAIEQKGHYRIEWLVR